MENDEFDSEINDKKISPINIKVFKDPFAIFD